ncbi:MAG: hypothetical protein A2201_11520 [Alicyclobacillus sp. RIFOXYA1_FULL_53_8]|nr:MAG: hypothetical protein A2201_11520 [Alicyclobacillus sp. RIFOXYA1_FULL_53_8]
MKPKSYVLVAVLLIILFFSYWGFVRYEHANVSKVVLTPLDKSKKGSYAIVAVRSFAQGEVVFVEQNPNLNIPSREYHAYYLKKSFWGWHIQNSELTTTGLGIPTYNVDLQFLNADGNTLVWGTKINKQLEQVVYHHDGKTYVSKPINAEVWYFTLPFTVNPIYNNELTGVLNNGTQIPLMK